MELVAQPAEGVHELPPLWSENGVEVPGKLLDGVRCFPEQEKGELEFSGKWFSGRARRTAPAQQKQEGKNQAGRSISDFAHSCFHFVLEQPSSPREKGDEKAAEVVGRLDSDRCKQAKKFRQEHKYYRLKEWSSSLSRIRPQSEADNRRGTDFIPGPRLFSALEVFLGSPQAQE